MIDNLEILEPSALLNRVHKFSDENYRYVTATCCNNGDGTYDLFYSFDREYQLVTLKTTVKEDESVPSISQIYLAAAFAENEIIELFGVKITGLVLDYGGHFILTEDAPESPFGSGVILVNKDGEKNAR